MTPNENDPSRTSGADEEEWVPEDDAVIGKAFKLSLIGFLVIGAIIAAVVLLNREDDDQGETVEVEQETTQTVSKAAEAPTVRFTEITKAAGVEFERQNGATGAKFLPETMGGGVAFFDYDSDGDEDLLLVNGAPWPGDPAIEPAPTPHLYANDGRGQFTDVTTAAGLDFVFQGMSPVVGDTDGDGDLDLFLTGVADDRYLVNEGGRFVDRTAQAGFSSGADSWGSSGVFFDSDGDGDLDLYICRYVRWSTTIDNEVDYRLVGVGRAYGPPTNYEGAFSELWRNDGGTFTEIGEAAGLHVTNPATGVVVGKALGVIAADLDGNGTQDLFVANDTVQNFLFKNEGGNVFSEIGTASFIAYGSSGTATGAMGVDLAHYRNDDSMGFVVGNFANEMSSLYLAEKGLRFDDAAIVDGIGAPSRKRLSFGVFFFDYDLDGRQDILQVNGHLEEEISQTQPSQTYEQPAQLFWNAGPDARKAFSEVDAAKTGDLLARPIVGRASAYADIDADGDLDVIMTQSEGAPLLFRNEQDLGNHWLSVKLSQPGSNPNGIGAWVTLEAAGTTQRQLVSRGRSYLAQVPATATFGLGAANAVDAVVVRWPDGTDQRIDAPLPDQVLVVERR